MKYKVVCNSFIATAVAKKISALSTETYLKQRAFKGSKEKFLKALDKVPDVDAEELIRFYIRKDSLLLFAAVVRSLYFYCIIFYGKD